eukprot:gene6781-4892_t
MSFKAELLSGMDVSVEYRESNQHGIIDNDSYSTLLPSRQLPSQFHIRPTWKPVELQQPFSEHETMVLPWKSQCIRNLLVFLILASFTKKQGDMGYNFESNYTLDDMMQCVHYEDMAELVGQLSIPTQMAFYNKIPTTNIAAAASVSSAGGGNSYGSSSRSSSRSMTPIPSMFAAAVTDVTSPKVPLSTTTASAAATAAAAARGRGQSLSSMSSSASLATTGNTAGTATADAQSQAIESDRYFQPVLRYLFQTEPSAPLAELLGGKQAGPGMFLDIIDLATPRTPHSTTSTNDAAPPKPIDELLALLPTPVDGVHTWLEHFAVIAGLLPTKTTNIIRLWQHCLRELQQHFDLQAPVPAFAHIVGVANTTSTGEEDEILSKRRAYIAAERKKPLYARMLWEDVLFQKGIQDDIAVTMPHPPSQSLFVPTYLRGGSSQSSSAPASASASSSSPSPSGPSATSTSTSTSPEYSSILLQQLQMVHFCTVVQQESPYASLSPPTVTTWSIDAASFRPGSTTSEAAAAHPMHIQQPKSLLRRIPLTEDMLAMQQHLSQKIFLDASRTFSSNPLLRFQVVLPNLLPHMQSFRQANPQAAVRDFYHWYGLDHAPLSLIDALIGEADRALDILWTQHCALDAEKDAALMPPPTEMTKTQFSADKEMTKAIAALERMSVAGLGEELLYLALCFNWRLLQQTVQALHSDEARHRAYQAMKPMIQKIADLHRLRARYPSSTFTRIMRNTFLHAMETPTSTSTTTVNNTAASNGSATPAPADSTATVGSLLPSLQVPLPPGEVHTESKITSLFSLIRCYDELAEEMAQLEDIVYRLVQLEPVRTTLQPSDTTATSPHSPAVMSSPAAAATTAGRKVTVTRSQPSTVTAAAVVATTTTDAQPLPHTRSLSFTKRTAAPKTQWARLLRRWVPIVSPSSPKGRFTSQGPLPYALKDETEKHLLLQRMKVLTVSGTAVASNGAHDWHSTDGRELGAASAKRFDLRALLPSSSSHGIAADDRFVSDANRRSRRRRQQRQRQHQRRHHQGVGTTTTAPPAQPVKLEFDDEEPTAATSATLAPRSQTDKSQLQALWEYAEED